MTWKRNHTLRQKMLILPMGLMALATLGVGVFLSVAVDTTVRANERLRLQDLGSTLRDAFAGRSRTAALTVEMTVSQEELYERYRGDAAEGRPALSELLGQAVEQAGADLAALVDRDGREIVSVSASASPEVGPFDHQALAASAFRATQLPDLRAGLRAAIRSRLAAGRGGAYLVTTGPLVDGERRAVAALVLAQRVDQPFLQREKARLRSGVELSVGGEKGVLATTLPGFVLPATSGGAEEDFESRIGSKRYYHQRIRLPGSPVSLWLSLDAGANAASRRRIEIGVVAALAVSMLAVAVLLVGAVNSVAHPLSAVVSNLKEIASGDADLTRRLAVGSRDEVGNLAESFNRFSERMRTMMRRLGSVASDLLRASDQVGATSRQVSEGALKQARLLGDSVKALQGIDQAVGGVAQSTSELLDTAARSSAATQQLGATTEEVASQVEGLFANVDEVSSSIAQMSTVSQQITASIESLASSAEETASAVVQLDASVADIEQNAETTSALSEETVRDAERGREAVEASIQGVTVMKDLADRANRVIEDLGSRATAIGKILNVIDEVADQTSLLALNAAIIAAQAGEHGKGFAVVATEIGELAERTAASTQEISAIIDHLQQGAREAVTAMAAGRERAELEVARAREAGGALEKIRASAFKSLEQARAIAQATQEQARGSRQITQSVDRIATMLGDVVSATAQNNEGTQQLAQSALRMREIASRVKDQVREQAAGSQQIGAHMEHVRQMVERIDVAISHQVGQSSQALEAVSSIRAVADGNATRTAELDQVVELLARQTSALQEEVGAFKV